MFIFIKIVELVIAVIIVLISHYIPLHLLDYDINNFSSFNFLAIFIAIASVLIFLIAEYTDGEKVSKSRNVLKVLLCSTAIVVVISSLAFFLRGFSLPRSLIIIDFFIQTILLSLSRIFFRSLARKAMENKSLVIGLEDEKNWLFQKAHDNKLPKEVIAGYLNVQKAGGYCLLDILSEYTKVFISAKALKELSDKDLSLVSDYDIEVVIIPRKYEISILGAILIPLGDSVAMNIKKFGLSFEAQLIKRLFDIFCSLFTIILTFPIMLLTALIIYLEDKNTPFFFQERVTKDNRKFKLVKFRSMKINAESQTGVTWAASNDKRVTRVGRVIRSLWIDELPQLFNVLKGDMSIVGPRPERPQLIEKFIKTTPEFAYRTRVNAGITGYAQVLTSYDTLPENKLKLDLIYMRRWSFIFDLLIIIETIRVICMKILRIFFQEKNSIHIKVKEHTDKNYTKYIYE